MFELGWDDCLNTEKVTLVFTVIGGLVTFCSFIYVKIVKPGILLLQSHGNVLQSMDAIKKELTTNGGNSLKDAIIGLNQTCNRIETRQKVMEQRTKASLHYHNVPLFETDHQGRLVWANNSFHELISEDIDSIDGFDWLSYIHEDEREDFFEEFQSCIKMNRKFVKETLDNHHNTIKLIGFPYKINDDSHGGFLISVNVTIAE